jgi:predicted ATPase
LHTVKSIEVVGFRDQRDLCINLHPDVNFFIGRNGTGKTTLISLLAATLQGNFEALSRLAFQSVVVHLRAADPNVQPKIEVKRITEGTSPGPVIEFSLKDGSSTAAKTVRFESSGYWQSRAMHDYPAITPAPEKYAVRRRPQGGRSIQAPPAMVDLLRKLVRSSWLSIHRANLEQRLNEGEYDTSIDAKVSQLHSEFPKYFSSLDSIAQTQFRRFQETYFLALLTEPRSEVQQWFHYSSTIDLDGDRKALEQIFSNLRMSPASFQTPLDDHFRQAKEADERYRKFLKKSASEPSDLKIEDFYFLEDSRRIRRVINQWNEYQKLRAETYLPKENFLTILNRLFDNKEVAINDRNEPTISLPAADGSRYDISLFSLSSGEKQMFILLGEALLGEQRPWVYIADEPELSLHMDWQEKLVTSLRDINPNGQIIFATHSPEILGPFGDRAIEIGKL